MRCGIADSSSRQGQKSAASKKPGERSLPVEAEGRIAKRAGEDDIAAPFASLGTQRMNPVEVHGIARRRAHGEEQRRELVPE